ncbi:aflatoxin efflux pump AFLT [Acrodontium crateriforme]|uniref:Aflatoxin efflux pump AFLT n=1 Tax=Acrodontium crateriforme TaxID=150365 RepID=A0AAQ3M9U5_9PEZI|nr:aflatoxin efflux pump AFLT [Acrodontium crateriforme]
MFGPKVEKNDEPVENVPANDEDDTHVYPSGLKLGLIIISIYIAMFLVALTDREPFTIQDKLIIATAIPSITNEFHTSNDIGWYGTAYLLCNAAFLPVFGKVYKVFNVKVVFLSAIVLFEIGSAVCGSAPNSIAFILGRAIAGMGAAAVQSGCLVAIVYAVPLAKRPKYQGGVGAVFGVSSILGPTLGGALTDSTTWRWCFYINLPFAVLVLPCIFFFLTIPERDDDKKSLKEKILQLNFEGLAALLPGVVCLCLALQWGGFTYSWNNGRIIALLVLAVVLLIGFVLIQIWRPERAMIPPKIFTQRSVVSGFVSTCCLGASQTLTLYYLPVWFQAIKGDSPVHSGIQLLALTLAMVVASIFSGIMTGKLGYYTPFLITGICLVATGTGLLNTLQVDTPIRTVIGFQILCGLGFGSSSQAPNLAAQTVLKRDDISIGVSLMMFGMTLFSAIFVQIGQNVLDNQLIKGLQKLVDITSQQIENAGATDLLSIIPAAKHEAALQVYNSALKMCFRVAVIMACIAIFGGATMEWRSVKKARKEAQAKEKTLEEGQTEEKTVEVGQAHDGVHSESESETKDKA